MTTSPIPASDTRPTFDAWFIRPQRIGFSIATILVILLTLVSVGLHFSNLDAIGDSNTYYTAAVEAMTQSLYNFFFVAAEPGGSVTVDKPPLGLWIEALFALVLGVNGFTTSLPNMLAGVLSVPLLYWLVRKYLGAPAGVIAALVLVVTPVVIAADRNNTADGMLTFTLLLAAWAFIQATSRSSLGYLLLGAVILGFGFNIKMLQAYLPLPAFFALYLLAARAGWIRKVLQLALAGGIVLAISLSWALVVDAVPVQVRPYIGSSTDNTVMELIVGHNGLNRLFGGRHASRADDTAQPPLADGQPGQLPPRQYFGLPPGDEAPSLVEGGSNDQPPQDDRPTPPAGNKGPGSEVGEAGLLRFFQAPLGKEMSWLLPFALVSLALLLFNSRLQFPLLAPAHKALILWGGWLMTCLVFFSSAAFFHAYYMVMLAPALAALVGGGFAWVLTHRSRMSVLLLAAVALLTVLFQIWLANQFTQRPPWLIIAVAIFILSCSLTLPALLARSWIGWRHLASASLLFSMLVIPSAWTILTLLNPIPNNANLPGAYAGDQAQGQVDRLDGIPGDRPAQEDALVTFLVENSPANGYLLAVPNANSGASLVLETGRAVLYMGGFTGSDPVIDAAGLQALVETGDLRFIMTGSNQGAHREVAAWAARNCRVVPQFSQLTAQRGQPGMPSGNILYDCAP